MRPNFGRLARGGASRKQTSIELSFDGINAPTAVIVSKVSHF